MAGAHPHRRASWLLVLVVSLAGGRAIFAGPRVVVVESPDRPGLPTLAARVAVQAGPAVSITTVAETVPDVAAFAAVAPRLVIRHDATLVVWVAPPDSTAVGDRSFVVYVAGRSTDRALVELVRIRATTSASEVERTIALKIATLLDSLLTTPAGAALGVSSPPRSSWSLGLGAIAAIESGDRVLVVGPEVALARRWGAGSWSVAARGTSRWLLTPTIERAGARTDIHDIGALAGGAVERSFPRWSVSASAGAGAAVLLASAASADGRSGSASVVVPCLAIGVGLRMWMSGRTSLDLTIGFERALIHQRFLADGERIASLGRSRFSVGWTVSVPL